MKTLSPESGNTPSLLCIEDPLNKTNDVGRSSFGVLRIKNYFESAYWTLIRAINPQNAKIYQDSITILGRIILIPPELTAYRQYIKKSYLEYQIWSTNNYYYSSNNYVNRKYVVNTPEPTNEYFFVTKIFYLFFKILSIAAPAISENASTETKTNKQF